MKFVADVNIEKRIVDKLRQNKYDVKWILEDNAFLKDIEIFEIANKEKRILLTNDKDFGEIVFRQKLMSSGIILFRIKGQIIEKKIELLNKLLSMNYDLGNYYIVISDKKIRMIKHIK